MSARSTYCQDVVKDCIDAVEHFDLDRDAQTILAAALILADAINGVRKALLEKQ
jgi:hypothetical protein